MTQLCDEEGCPHYGANHVCIDVSRLGRRECVAIPADLTDYGAWDHPALRLDESEMVPCLPYAGQAANLAYQVEDLARKIEEEEPQPFLRYWPDVWAFASDCLGLFALIAWAGAILLIPLVLP